MPDSPPPPYSKIAPLSPEDNPKEIKTEEKTSPEEIEKIKKQKDKDLAAQYKVTGGGEPSGGVFGLSAAAYFGAAVVDVISKFG